MKRKRGSDGRRAQEQSRTMSLHSSRRERSVRESAANSKAQKVDTQTISSPHRRRFAASLAIHTPPAHVDAPEAEQINAFASLGGKPIKLVRLNASMAMEEGTRRGGHRREGAIAATRLDDLGAGESAAREQLERPAHLQQEDNECGGAAARRARIDARLNVRACARVRSGEERALSAHTDGFDCADAFRLTPRSLNTHFATSRNKSYPDRVQIEK
eukprot:6196967-Pleurochrysis_carterae.AAC.3